MKLKVDIDAAIEALDKNLKDHIVELQEAVEVWSAEMITAIERFRDAVDRIGLKASCDDITKLSYGRPTDSRADYSRYIGALRRAKECGQTTVEIDEDDYDRMFNDNWDWRIQSKTSNSVYKK